ncbi:MFS transporter [Cystobacter fuscus]|uniref:MFS transporter n=1 Tax=Cystobacter fuscus TaxID=43 RepID=UPI002B2FADBD|nr:MFS transporter [Cystobacter fuscus]
MLPLLSIALGAFAIGTEGFMLAGLLPAMSGDLGVSIPAVGQLVTVFSLTFALGSPVLAVSTGHVDRKRLLMGSMVVFALGNFLAAMAHGYGTLLVARIIMALAASAYMPAASAYAAATAPERRGRAISLIYVGLNLATVVGAPLGVFFGGHFGWRPTFLGVAALAVLAMGGIWWMLAPRAAARPATFAERLSVARLPEVLGALVVNVVAQIGIFALYTYLAPFLYRTVGIAGSGVAAVLFLYGAGGVAGNLIGGAAVDRFPSRRLLAAIFASLAALFMLLSLAGHALPAPVRLPVVVALILLWGLINYAFPSVQQTRLVRMEPRLAPVTLSLNASATYLGISLGAALGSLVVAHGGELSLGFVAGACELLGLVALRLEPEMAPSASEAAGPYSESNATTRPGH